MAVGEMVSRPEFGSTLKGDGSTAPPDLNSSMIKWAPRREYWRKGWLEGSTSVLSKVRISRPGSAFELIPAKYSRAANLGLWD